VSDHSRQTFDSNLNLSDLVLLAGSTASIKHADQHFAKISKAVRTGYAKCFTCPNQARTVTIVQVRDPDGLLIHAVCEDCFTKMDVAVKKLKNTTNAIYVTAAREDGDMVIAPFGSTMRLQFPSKREVPQMDSREVKEEE